MTRPSRAAVKTTFEPPARLPHGDGSQAWSEHLQRLLESTGEGKFGIDLDGCCTFINRAGAQMLGRRTEEVLGRDIHALIHHTHADGRHYPEAECPICNALRQGLPCRIDSEVLWRADGSSFSAEILSYPMVDGGVVQGAVVTFFDIGERPGILDQQGLWAALEWQALEFIEATELQRELTVHVTRGVASPSGQMGRRWSDCVFRIFREMLVNVARHARARTVRIRLLVDSPPDPVLHLEVEDDGVGATPEQLAAPNCHGVMGMRERAGRFGGTVSIRSAPRRGTRVLLTMPLPRDQPMGLQPVAVLASSGQGTFGTSAGR